MATYDHADRHYPRTLAPVERPSLRRSPTAMRTPTSHGLEAFAAAPAYEAQRDALPDYDASAPIAALPTSTVSSIMPISTVFSKHTAQRSKVSMLLQQAENEEDAGAPLRSLTGAEIKALGKCSQTLHRPPLLGPPGQLRLSKGLRPSSPKTPAPAVPPGPPTFRDASRQVQQCQCAEKAARAVRQGGRQGLGHGRGRRRVDGRPDARRRRGASVAQARARPGHRPVKSWKRDFPGPAWSTRRHV